MTAEPESESRDTVPRVVGDRVARLAGVAVVLGLVVVIIARQADDKPPEVTQAGATPTQPADAAPPGPIGVGTASNGAAWTLAFGQPAAALCLTVAVVGTDETRFRCGLLPAADSAPAAEAYEPLRHSDPQTPQFVYGRLPPGVAETEVILADGGSLGRVPTIPGFGGSFYAVELTGSGDPVAVVGYPADGTSVRFELPT